MCVLSLKEEWTFHACVYCAGPWFVGEFLTNHTGVLFVWGFFVKGTFIPGSLTYFYGVFQVTNCSLDCSHLHVSILYMESLLEVGVLCYQKCIE